MTHSDDLGLVLPPKLAPIQVVIVPVYKGQEQLVVISERVNTILKAMRAKGISVKFDDRDVYRPGAKFAEYELKGVPIRIAIGSRDLENNTLELARRDTLEKQVISQVNVVGYVSDLLEEIQENLFKKAVSYRNELITEVDSFDEFEKVINNRRGFISAHWDGTIETENKIKELTKATIRCIPNVSNEEMGLCVLTGKKSLRRVLFAKAY